MAIRAKDISFTGKETLRETFRRSNLNDILKNHHQSFELDISKNEMLNSFQGDMPSSEAESFLKKSEDGTFLLRKSARFPDNIILSFKKGQEVSHFPIKSLPNGTFYFRHTFLVDAEDLISFLKKDAQKHFNVELKRPIKGTTFPEHMWKKGYTTMLHKVVTEGTLENLETLLKSQHCSNINLKNEEGNTALHMACYIGRDDMVRLLLLNKATTNVLNMHGWTPLQMAVLGNNPSTISLLMDEGQAGIDARNSMNMFTALHCAAACNNVESLKKLLDLGANKLALNDEDKTPLQVAKVHNSGDCIKELSARQSKPATSKLSDWYHGELSDEEQSKIESLFRFMNGAFYVRKSSSSVNYYVACLCWNGKWKHSRIRARDDGLVQYNSEYAFESLEHAVAAFLEKFSSAVHPVSASDVTEKRRIVEATIVPRPDLSSSKSFSGAHPSISTLKTKHFSASIDSSSSRISPESVDKHVTRSGMEQKRLRHGNSRSGLSGSRTGLKSAGQRSANSDITKRNHAVTSFGGATSFGNFFGGGASAHHDKRQIFDTINLKNIINKGLTSLRSKAFLIPRIESMQIQFGHQLGQGNFGKVYSGYFTDENLMTYPVAIKVLKESMEGAQKKEFLQEASVMRQLLHPFIVRLYGIVTDRNKLWMVQELLPLGSLFEKLTTSGAHPSLLKTWILQICSGMQFMESSHYLHRDLAARNILLASQDQVKISDFGLSRYTGNSSSYEYVQHSDSPIPFQWYAPEAFAEYHFTSKGDVWSFGVVIWEMYTNCKFPYGNVGQEPTQLLHYLQQGGRLERPSSCPSTTWAIVVECWRMTPNHRPSFDHLSKQFASLPEYKNAVSSVGKMLKWHH